MFEKDKLNLLSALDAAHKISDYSKDYDSADNFFEHQRDFDAAMMNFIIIGEMIARLSEEFIDKYNDVDWHKIRGFRNIVAHNYFGIDAEEVWDIIISHLPLLVNDLNRIIAEL